MAHLVVHSLCVSSICLIGARRHQTLTLGGAGGLGKDVGPLLIATSSVVWKVGLRRAAGGVEWSI